MASSHHDEPNYYLPITWPFRAAGTLMVLTTIWFCTGWGIRDLGPEERLWQHMNIFWLGLALSIVFVLVGGAMNISQAKRREAALEREAAALTGERTA